MKAVIKRELFAYLISPPGYVYVGVMFFFSGYFIFTYNVYGATSDTSAAFGQLYTVSLFMAPLLTMRLLSEERRHKTDLQLLTAPVSAGAVVLGKYLSAITVHIFAVSATLPETGVLTAFGRVDWPVAFGNYAGLILLGLAQTAVCLFLSSLTESQFIAAVLGVGAGMLLTLIDAVSLLMPGGAVQDLLLSVSFNRRFSQFTSGIFDFGGAAYFISVAALFVSLTAASLDRRRWN